MSAVALSGKPSNRLSVPRRVSILLGASTPGDVGVEYFYFGLAGGPLGVCAMAGAAISVATETNAAARNEFNRARFIVFYLL